MARKLVALGVLSAYSFGMALAGFACVQPLFAKCSLLVLCICCIVLAYFSRRQLLLIVPESERTLVNKFVSFVIIEEPGLLVSSCIVGLGTIWTGKPYCIFLISALISFGIYRVSKCW